MGIDEDHSTYSEESFLANSLHFTKADMRKSDFPVIECQGAVTAIVCSPITKSTLQRAANFMALHAVVQLVELNPRYEVFNKWAKYVTQVGLYILDALIIQWHAEVL